MKPIKVKKNKIKKRHLQDGRWVRVIFDDIGAVDGVVVDRDKYGDKDFVDIFFVSGGHVVNVHISQIVKTGNFLEAKRSGL